MECSLGFGLGVIDYYKILSARMRNAANRKAKILGAWGESLENFCFGWCFSDFVQLV